MYFYYSITKIYEYVFNGGQLNLTRTSTDEIYHVYCVTSNRLFLMLYKYDVMSSTFTHSLLPC